MKLSWQDIKQGWQDINQKANSYLQIGTPEKFKFKLSYITIVLPLFALLVKAADLGGGGIKKLFGRAKKEDDMPESLTSTSRKVTPVALSQAPLTSAVSTPQKIDSTQPGTQTDKQPPTTDKPASTILPPADKPSPAGTSAVAQPPADKSTSPQPSSSTIPPYTHRDEFVTASSAEGDRNPRKPLQSPINPTSVNQPAPLPTDHLTENLNKLREARTLEKIREDWRASSVHSQDVAPGSRSDKTAFTEKLFLLIQKLNKLDPLHPDRLNIKDEYNEIIGEFLENGNRTKVVEQIKATMLEDQADLEEINDLLIELEK